MEKPSLERIWKQFLCATDIIEKESIMTNSHPDTHTSEDLKSDMGQRFPYGNSAKTNLRPDPTPEEWDQIAHPKHYAQTAVESWDYQKDFLTREEWHGKCKGTIVEYLTREKWKGGKQDVLKAKAWLDKFCETYED